MVLIVAWKMTDYLLPQVAAVNVCIYFRSRDVFVTQHGLNGAKVGSALQEVGSEGMSKSVW